MNAGERVRKVVADYLNISPEKVTPEASLINDLAADSLDVVQITMALEEEFDIEFGEEAEISDPTVQGIVDYVESKLGAAV